MERNVVPTKPGLDKTFSSKDVFAMAFGTMIGWGWIMLSGKWAVDAGMIGAMLAYAVGAVLCIFVGLVYSELTPAIPYTGGSVVFSYKAIGYWSAVFSGLATAFSYLGVAAWEGPAFAAAFNYILPVPQRLKLWTIQGSDVYGSVVIISMLVSVIITYLNYRGAKQTAFLQSIATAGLIAVGLIFLTGGVFKGNMEYTRPYFTDTKGFFAVLLMVPAMFVGFDVIPQSAGEMDVPLKKIPRILILSICAAALWYMLMILSTCLSAPTEIRVNGEIPVADAMAYNFGSSVWGKICIIGAICGILTSWNGFLYGGARVLFSLANAKMLPECLGKVHPKYNTPSNAVLLCGTVSTLSCLLGTGALTWFVNASSFGVVLVYFMASLSFVFLRKNRPDFKRPYKVKAPKFVGAMSIIVSLGFAFLYLPMGPSHLEAIEWLFVLAWFVLGFILAIYAKFKYKDVTAKERETLLFRNEG